MKHKDAIKLYLLFKEYAQMANNNIPDKIDGILIVISEMPKIFDVITRDQKLTGGLRFHISTAAPHLLTI
ncbi:hypothetical protein ABW49_23370 [Enterobacter asburiae]|nr:hypothetical protein SR74_23525 [Enterobacter asburiae]KOQ85706.1 hypothetical protein ABW49_23370 [Enterobacter asburiae]